MTQTTDLDLLQRIQAIMPELPVEHFERNNEGLINDVLIVNHNLVFRFAKNEKYARLLQSELKLLDLIRPRLNISVPSPVFTAPDTMVYPLLPGRPLSRLGLLRSPESVQDELAAQLGSLFHCLHTTPTQDLDWQIPATRAPVRREDWLKLQQDVKTQIYPLLQAYQIEWADDLFGRVLDDPSVAEYQPALIHGDLASYHILFDQPPPQITGLIDFGMAGMGDPASDIGNLINIYGETFVRRMRQTYPQLERFLPRARFYSQLIELEWILRGFESGERFWFTGHLGNSRDILI
jgi:aminoglycoside 2''-phosphotransferase